MQNYTIELELLSDTTFGRGDGVPGLIDQEIEYDQYGCPFLRGRSLKGLISDECDTFLNSLDRVDNAILKARQRLFGQAGSTLGNEAILHIGDATLPQTLRQNLVEAQLPSYELLQALTVVRRQTSITDGIPETGSLRSMRAAIRGLRFESEVMAIEPLTRLEAAVLAASCLALRRAGSNRNRGRGRVACRLLSGQTRVAIDALIDALGEQV